MLREVREKVERNRARAKLLSLIKGHAAQQHEAIKKQHEKAILQQLFGTSAQRFTIYTGYTTTTTSTGRYF